MRATYRLQLTREFPLRAACAVTGYLARLGVSHLYSSPILAARAGRTQASGPRPDATVSGAA